MIRPCPAPIRIPARKQHHSPSVAAHGRLATSPGTISITSSSLASTSGPLPILKAEAVRVFNQARALYISITVVHTASGARASFAVPKKMLVALDDYQARSEDLRSAAHRLIVSVEADERRQANEREQPDAVKMLGSRGQQVIKGNDRVTSLDILIQELQHLDDALERLEWEWNRSDVAAYWYGPCTMPEFVDSETEATSSETEVESLFANTRLGGSAASSTRRIFVYGPLSPGAGRSRLVFSPAGLPLGSAVVTRRTSHPVSPLTPLDMPAPYRPPARHRSGASSSGHKPTQHVSSPSKLDPLSTTSKRPHARSKGSEEYFPALAFREWEDDELDVGRTRDIVLGCML